MADMVRNGKMRNMKKKDWYTPEEFSAAVDVLITESAERLRKKLRAAWKKNAMKRRHGATV